MEILKAIGRKKELRQKLIVTALLLLLVNALPGIPTPGINAEALRSMVESSSALGILRVINGAGLGNASLTFLSISPYITASIIVELMTIVIPSLEEMAKDGEVGREQFKRVIFIVGIVMAALQASAVAIGFSRKGFLVSREWYWILCVAACWTLTSVLLQVVGDIWIEKKGIGKGISLILLCNILSSYPSDAYSVYQKFIEGKQIGQAILSGVLIIVFFLGLFAFTITVQETEKRFPVQYSAKLGGRIAGNRSYFPYKLWSGSVVPIIFSQSLMSMPAIIAALAGKENIWWINMLNSARWFESSHPSYTIGAIIYIALIFLFSFFYTNIVINPIEIADNLKRSGGTLIGIRPGTPTTEYLRRKTKMVIGIGAAALCIIGLIPCILAGVFGMSRIAFASTSIIITVSVLIEMRDHILSEIQIELHHTKLHGVF